MILLVCSVTRFGALIITRVVLESEHCMLHLLLLYGTRLALSSPLPSLCSELNKKINSASLSCLGGCSKVLEELVVCPVLWKGQWQVLPTLPGLKRLVLVHCREMSHLREVCFICVGGTVGKGL